MALGKKPYPKATIKKIIKAHSDHNLKKNADVTVRLHLNASRISISNVDALLTSWQIFLDYVLFMETYGSDEHHLPSFIKLTSVQPRKRSCHPLEAVW